MKTTIARKIMEPFNIVNYLNSVGGGDMSLSNNLISFCIPKTKAYDEKQSITKDEFIELINENRPSLYRVAKGILKNEHDVEDAASEAILKAYKNLHSLSNLECFKPWLIRILVNECYAILKQRNRIDLQENLEILNLTYEDKKSDELMDSINKLKEDHRTVLILFYYEDMSIKDISSVLEISEGTVKSRLNRAKEKLKAILEKEKRRDQIG